MIEYLKIITVRELTTYACEKKQLGGRSGKVGLEDLTELERRTYELIRKAAEIQPKNLPASRMMGAVSNLKSKGLVEVFKKHTSM